MTIAFSGLEPSQAFLGQKCTGILLDDKKYDMMRTVTDRRFIKYFADLSRLITILCKRMFLLNGQMNAKTHSNIKKKLENLGV